MRVYLAGGMKSGWRSKVREYCSGLSFVDPCVHGLSLPEQYTAWDLCGVRTSDVVFAYMETDNPSGVGLSLEIGYAIALGKTVIFVDEKRDARMKIIREASSIVFDEFQVGVEFLKSFENMP